MVEIAVVGENEFNLGFRLAGVRNVFEVSKTDIEKTIDHIFNTKSIGCIIMSQPCMAWLDEEMQNKLVASVMPVTVVIGEEDKMDSLKNAIKKAVGVDLWK